ncbi:MAG TPA: DUF4360 domain-containing protein [Leptolyngbyaceae cyanobacterium]
MHAFMTISVPTKICNSSNSVISGISSTCGASGKVVATSRMSVHFSSVGFKLTPSLVTVSGNGCPQGTAQGTLNGDTLSGIFSQFKAKASPSKVVSKSCNLRVSLDIFSGYTVRINGKYTGFADVPPGGSSNLNVKLLFQGRVIAKDNLNFSPGFSNTWEKNVPVTLGTTNACTQPVQSVFGINTSLTSRAKNVRAGGASQVRVENMNYQIKFNRC